MILALYATVGRGAIDLILLILALAGFVIWASTPLGPMPGALAALQSDDQVKVDTDSWLAFLPTEGSKATGFIFYPGGRVDPRSYAPAARAIAAAGYPAIIVPMPLNLAVFGAGKADEVKQVFPEVTRWAIGGHSLDGAMAANYAGSNPDGVDGLVLWAAWTINLSPIPVSPTQNPCEGL